MCYDSSLTIGDISDEMISGESEDNISSCGKEDSYKSGYDAFYSVNWMLCVFFYVEVNEDGLDLGLC